LDVDRCTVAVYLNDGSWVAMLAPAAQPGAASFYPAVKITASTRLAAFMDFHVRGAWLGAARGNLGSAQQDVQNN
jgi:hypothetical protein